LPKCLEDHQYSLIINLSEDVAIDTIVIGNHEDFSDPLSEIAFFGSIDYPPDSWLELGRLNPEAGKHEHALRVEMDRSRMIRYLKIDMRGKLGNELYCTLTSLRYLSLFNIFRVHGSGMHVVMRNSLLDLVNNESTQILHDQ